MPKPKKDWQPIDITIHIPCEHDGRNLLHGIECACSNLAKGTIPYNFMSLLRKNVTWAVDQT
jgi:hypothetical protein